MSATRMPYPSAQPVYAAVEEWRDRCLLDDRSLFSGEPGSTLANGEELVRDFVEQPDAGSADFLTKLAGQLAQTSPGAVQLAAELLYVYLLPARSESVGGSTKRRTINRVLDFTPGTAAIPDRLGAVLEAGLVRMGTAYGSYRWKLFAFLIEAFVEIKRLSLEERRRVLADPSAFVVLLDRLDDTKGGAIQKYALEHLLFPDHFSPAISADARRTILSRWAHLATPPEAPEPVRLGNVHRALAAEAGHPDGFVDLWRAPWLWEWSDIDSRWQTAATWLAWWKERAALDAEERDYKVQNAHQLLTIAHGADPVAALDAFLAAETNLVDWRARDGRSQPRPQATPTTTTCS
ncbi:MAG TPA: hypothetical protein VFE45_14730, partial [Coriobacteriia bacterium]|nr:hypothetical protein [Coriobacteriia bacterium]